MIWQIPKMWEEGECWIIGGGPSMPRLFGVPEDTIEKVRSQELPASVYSPFLSPIHGKHVIGVNAAFLIGEWMDVIFSGDGGFYWENRELLAQYPNIQVSCNPNLRNKNHVHNTKFVPRDGKHPKGITTRGNHVSWNGNTGAAAINLAYHFGVKRIYLLGFDMKLGPEDAQHWHGHYKTAKTKKEPKKLPFHRHLLCWPHIAKDARLLKIEILNVSPDSAIKELRKVELKEVL